MLVTTVASAQEKKDKDKAAPAQEKKAKPADLDKIPKAVMDALKSKFPKVEIEKWVKETENNQGIYELEGVQDGKKCEADIREDGTILNFEKEFPANNLPAAVKKAVEAKYPKAKMKEVLECTEVKDKKETLTGYEIVVETADKKEAELTIAPDGKVLEDSADQPKDDKKDEKKKDEKKDEKKAEKK